MLGIFLYWIFIICTACPLIFKLYLFFGLLFERDERETSKERRREHGSNLSRLETASELKKKMLILNLSRRRLYKLQANISCMCTISSYVQMLYINLSSELAISCLVQLFLLYLPFKIVVYSPQKWQEWLAQSQAETLRILAFLRDQHRDQWLTFKLQHW